MFRAYIWLAWIGHSAGTIEHPIMVTPYLHGDFSGTCQLAIRRARAAKSTMTEPGPCLPPSLS